VTEIRGATDWGAHVNTARLMGAADEAVGPELEKAPTEIPGQDQIAEADRVTMASRRWADATAGNRGKK